MLSTRWRPQPTSGPRASGTSALSDAEWQIVLSGRAHVLFEGSKSVLRKTIDRLIAELPRPVERWSKHCEIPAAPYRMIVEDVAALGDADQQTLFELMSGPFSPAQVISTSTTRVYDAVLRHQFDAELYYRLNTVRLELGPEAGRSGGTGRRVARSPHR